MPPPLVPAALVINGGTIDNSSGADLTLTNNNPVTLAANFTFTGSGNLNLGTGPVTLNANPTITVGANTLTIGGIISNGTGNKLTMAGAGNLVLTGVNTFTGGITVNSGTVRLNNAAAGGTGAAVVNTGGTLVAGGSLTNPVTLAGGTFGAITGLANGFSGDFTAAAGTTSTVYMSDPQNLVANSEVITHRQSVGQRQSQSTVGHGIRVSMPASGSVCVASARAIIAARSRWGTMLKPNSRPPLAARQFSPGGTGNRSNDGRRCSFGWHHQCWHNHGRLHRVQHPKQFDRQCRVGKQLCSDRHGISFDQFAGFSPDRLSFDAR